MQRRPVVGTRIRRKGLKMKAKDLLKELENIPPETEIEIESGPYHYKAAWVMFFKGVLTLGFDETGNNKRIKNDCKRF